MFRFEYPFHLSLLLLVVVAVAAFLWYQRWRKSAVKKIGDEEIVTKLFPEYSKTKHLLKFILVSFSLLLIVLGYANFQWGSAGKKINHAGIDLAIVLDISNSMLANDVKPDRLTIAKQFAANIINHFPDDRIAIITFAGAPFLQLPLTPDHAAAQMLIADASEKNSPEQGSDLGLAITSAINALPENQNHYKAILLLSDGEDFEPDLADALRTASDEHIMICTVGIGTEQGSNIPIKNAGNEFPLLRDEKGEVVLTKLNEETLKQIATATNGIYVHPTIEINKSLKAIANRLDAVKKNYYDEKLFTEYESRFQIFLLGAFIILVIDFLNSSKKQKLFSFKQKQKAT